MKRPLPPTMASPNLMICDLNSKYPAIRHLHLTTQLHQMKYQAMTMGTAVTRLARLLVRLRRLTEHGYRRQAGREETDKALFLHDWTSFSRQFRSFWKVLRLFGKRTMQRKQLSLRRLRSTPLGSSSITRILLRSIRIFPWLLGRHSSLKQLKVMRNLPKREEYLSSSIVIVLDQISWLVKAMSTWHLATQLDCITRQHRGRGND
ncbi:hypothetical protein E4U38_000822 [Claviceps purpurea]|nr:hypothetical protein E4U38_000822 [Claviceps purpurea]